jgi:hypothetical protein
MATFDSSGDGGPPQIIKELCGTHLQALHNLLFLVRHEVEVDSKIFEYLRAAQIHLDRVTEKICGVDLE